MYPISVALAITNSLFYTHVMILITTNPFEHLIIISSLNLKIEKRDLLPVDFLD